MIDDKQTDNQSDLLKKGILLGHKVASRHPKMKSNLAGVRGGFDIIDEDKSKESLEKAKTVLKDAVVAGKKILVVGTKVQAKEAVQNFANECGFFYITERWLGGTISNFDVIKKRIKYLKSIETKKADGSLSKYTKKEQIKIEKELATLIAKYGGMKGMEKTPELLIAMDMKKDHYAIKEATENNIPVIAIADTNVNPTLADYPIFVSDDVVDSIRYVLDNLKEAVSSVKGQEPKKAE